MVPVPVDLGKWSNVVRNDVVKKVVYIKLVAKVNKIDTCGFVLKTKCDADTSKLENKIPDSSRFAKNTSYNSKTSEL